MKVKISKYSFLRVKQSFLYIFNQLNYAERYYELDSIDFFDTLSKNPRSIDDIVFKLKSIFDIDEVELRNDFVGFIHDLEKDGFVVSGYSVEEISKKELKFSYQRFNKLKVSRENTESSDPVENGNKIIKIQQNTDELFVENLYLEVTRRCNELCLHCYIPQNQRTIGEFISLEDAKNYINQAKDLGIWELTITGGEPFLHPEINEILKYAREKDVIIAILSNLTVLNDTHIETLKEIYPSHIQVSLYSLKPEIHDSITGVTGSHKRTIESIEKCYKNDIPLQVNCPIIEVNKNDFQDVLDWVRAKGIKANADFNIMAQTDFELNNMVHTLSFENAKVVYKKMLQDDTALIEEYRNMYKNTETFIPEPSKHVCGACYNTLYISAKGKVYPCANWQSFELGDLHNKCLKDIYLNGKKTEEVRNIKLSNYMDAIGKALLPFTKICPSHFANSNQGDYTTMPDDVLENARMKKEAVDEVLKLKNNCK
jgi:MoaA/NifB/PqqE/SkfB family radical SAM enzyme